MQIKMDLNIKTPNCKVRHQKRGSTLPKALAWQRDIYRKH